VLTISVVSTGSKLVASGAVGPDVSAQEIIGDTVFASISRIRKTAMVLRRILFRIIRPTIIL
jgi:hypothetical protein